MTLWRIGKVLAKKETRKNISTMTSYVIVGLILSLIFYFGGLYIISTNVQTRVSYGSEEYEQTMNFFRTLIFLAAISVFFAMAYEGAKEADLKQYKKRES